MQGALPASWSALTALTYIRLSQDQVSGPLPASWSTLTGLKMLDLSFNKLTGPLPASWSALTQVRSRSRSRSRYIVWGRTRPRGPRSRRSVQPDIVPAAS